MTTTPDFRLHQNGNAMLLVRGFMKITSAIYGKKSESDNKKRKNENFEKKKHAFLSHVPRITQPKQKILA